MTTTQGVTMDRITPVDVVKAITVPLEERHEDGGYTQDLTVVLYEDRPNDAGPVERLRIYTAGLSGHLYVDVKTGDPDAVNEPWRWDIPRWEEAARFAPQLVPFEVITATIENLVEALLAGDES